jgi:hypothetical protein
MLKVKPAPRPLKAVSSVPTRATAPPICHSPMLLSGELIRLPCSATMSITESSSSATSQERT